MRETSFTVGFRRPSDDWEYQVGEAGKIVARFKGAAEVHYPAAKTELMLDQPMQYSRVESAAKC